MRPELSDHIQLCISQRSPLVLMIRQVFVEGLDQGWGKDVVSARPTALQQLSSLPQSGMLAQDY